MEMDLELYKVKVESELATRDSRFERLEQHCANLEKLAKESETKANENEQYSRRNNLRVWGLQLGSGEDAATAVVRLANNLIVKDKNGGRLVVREEDLEVAHTLRAPLPRPPPASPAASASEDQPAKTTTTPPPNPIIARFVNRSVRDAIIAARRQLKETGISISEDLTPKNAKLLTSLKKSVKVQEAWSWNGKINYILKADPRKKTL
jgi:UDP:flavonoid glycosyltransferase YjiC (YdhE family)